MEITNVSQLDSNQFINQDYKANDESLLNSLNISEEFGLPDDKVEVHVISPNGEILDSIYDFRNYTTRQTIQGTSLYNQIELDPKADLESFGINQGQYDITYNFYRPLFLSSEANRFYISEISSDRTEIKISNNDVSYTNLGQSYLTFVAERNSRAFYSDFILNFGDNKTYIGVNVAFDNSNEVYANLYIKLYEPLPANIKLKDTFWIVENISEPYAFQVDTTFLAEATLDTVPLRGPNINIELAEKTNLTTPYLNLSSLLNSSVSSSYQQLQSWLEEKSIEITVDYTDFNNFVHFSSARERLENFKYKLTQIQSLQSDINAINNLSISSSITYTSASVLNLQNQLNTLIEKFDGYEYFLYYESGSNSWPKTNLTKPYINSAVTTSAALTWFGSIDSTSQYYGGQILDADNYDINNKDYIWNNLPEYIKEDSQNANLELFTSMLGQHYDYIWTYIKDITDLQVADNRIDFGISKDLVADTLRNFGIKLYTNSRNQEDLYLSLLGIDSNNSTLPSTGSYMINNYVTASNNTIPDNDIVKETYKRIYHNLPYLLKTKGTRRGLHALINCFGITDTILKIKEYGGNKKDQDIIEQITPKFNYSPLIDTSLSNPNVIILGYPSYKQYLDLGSDYIYPDTFEFRFKLDSNNILPTQSVLETINRSQIIRVTHISESYANIDFGLSDNTGNYSYSTPITLPLYNDGWWNLNLTRETGSIDRYNTSYFNTPQTYTFTIGNKDSNGIQYLESCSIYRDGVINSNFINSWIDEQFYLGGSNYSYPFTGSVQEFRFWIGSIPINNFKDHILNPQSIVFDSVSGSYNNLIFRAPLGSELDKNTGILNSVHPSNTASFWNGTPFSTFEVIADYLDNYENYLINTPNIGSFTEIDEKIRIATPNLVPGDVLTPYISIQKPEIYPYTNDLNIVEVAISPQDSINADIIDQLGLFNIDEYIGDPRLAASGSYPALTDLRNFYFKKYSKKENVFDLIKLLSYFDNSLFKMIKDFVPAKANLSTGLVINTNILERNKIARHEPVFEFVDYSGSIETAFISGSNGLDKIYNTSYTSSVPSLSGSIPRIYTQNKELFNGELGGTIITVHSQSQNNIVYELNSIPTNSTQALYDAFYKIPINPTLNNVMDDRVSLSYLKVDYSTNPILPANYNYLTASLGNLNNNAYPFLKAAVQDSNYTLYRHITPRYNGSKLFNLKNNIYTDKDISYGNNPVIDYNSIKFAYFKEITSQSLTFPGRVNANIKYLIDSASNIIELTEANKNLFDVQSIFNRVNANVALDNTNQPSKQKSLNGLKHIYAGGFKYYPILQSINSASGSISFDLSTPSAVAITSGSGTGSIQYISGIVSVTGYSVDAPISTTTGTEFIIITSSLDSTLKVSYKKNFFFNGDLYQRITGSVTFKSYAFPGYNGESPQFFQNFTYTGTPYTLPAPIIGSWGYPSEGAQYQDFNLTDRIGSIIIPDGLGITSWNRGGPVTTWLGPSSASGNDYSNYQTPLKPRIADVFSVFALDNSASLETSNISNDFNPTGYSKTYQYGDTFNYITNQIGYTPTIIPNTQNIVPSAELIYSIGCDITYEINGYIKIPKSDVVGTTYTVDLLTLAGVPARLKGTTKFTCTVNGSRIKFTTPPEITTNNVNVRNNPYYYSSAPTTNYISTITDNGFFSGSLGTNWYFERGLQGPNLTNITGSDYYYLTSSYDLSNYYFQNIVNSNPINPFIQVETSSSQAIFDGYDNIEYSFLPKIGDLIRFYDYNRLTFPIDFEREIINIFPPSGVPISGSYTNRLVFEVSQTIQNQSCYNNSTTQIKDIIFMSKVEDETNVILLTNKQPGQTSAGILLPEYLDSKTKEDAGNIVKRLKSQNLI
jgi:hypothetical protein